jgi:hypothetical protein
MLFVSPGVNGSGCATSIRFSSFMRIILLGASTFGGVLNTVTIAQGGSDRVCIVMPPAGLDQPAMEISGSLPCLR